MKLAHTGRGHSLDWTTTFGLICIILTNHVVASATYGEHCDLPADCQGRGLTCSPVKLCACSEGFEHINGDNECQDSQTPFENDVKVPDLSFSSKSTFTTEMTSEDLDVPRMEDIKSQLEFQLTELFMGLTGFKEVDVTYMTIRENGILEAGWTVKLNRDDPKFVNATPEEIGDIVRPELEEASKRYKSAIHIDTSRHSRPMSSDKVKLALDLGLGLGLPLLILAVLAVVLGLLYCRKKEANKKAMSISDKSSSCESGISSKMEPDNYQYAVMKNGFRLPSQMGHFVAPSVTGSSSSVFMETSDKLPLHKSS